jgi:hypothetical protein
MDVASFIKHCPAATALTLAMGLTACAPASEDSLTPPPSAAPQVDVTAVEPVKSVASTPPGNAKAAPVQANVLSTTDPAGYSKKDIERIIEHLDWFAENYITQKNRIPTLDELKAWKDPNFPLGLPEWPKAPAGKKWAMNEKSGQFSLADDKP